MKFSCLQENLNKALTQVSRVATIKSSLPILENVLLKTETGRLKLVATDLETVIIYWVGGKIEKEGSVTVPCRLFSEYINSLPNNKIEITSKNGVDIDIFTDEYEANIKGQSVDDFPIIPEIKDKTFSVVDSNELTDALKEVVYSAAIDNSRPILAGVLFYFDKKILKLVATDSYRLSERKINLKNPVSVSKKIVIPAKTVIELQRVLEDIKGEIEVKLGESQVLFHSKNTEIIARLIDGNFPDYEKIIPEQYSTRAVISKDKFINIVKTASLFARDNGNNIKITLSPKGKIIVQAVASQVGENTSRAEAEITGTEGEISFNARYILDFLTNLKDFKVVLEIGGKLKPAVLKPEGRDNYLHIIMPLSV